MKTTNPNSVTGPWFRTGPTIAFRRLALSATMSAFALVGVSIHAQITAFYAPPYYAFTNFAGLSGRDGGGNGNVDGTGGDARFSAAEAIAVDPAGNIFVGDTHNYTVRKITPEGVVTTFAGLSGNGGTNDGVGGSARFFYTKGLATDPAGNVYVADEISHTIRKITPDAVVTTLAGRPGPPGYTNGPASEARFNRPSALVVDAQTNIYVADTYNHAIRKITPDGWVSTLAGGGAGGNGNLDGQGTNASFAYPLGIAVDAAGMVYVANSGASRIRRITPDGHVTTLAGGGSKGDAFGTNASMVGGPRGLAVDAAGNILVAQRDASVLRRITPDGAVTTIAGAAGIAGSTNGVAAAARFAFAEAIAIDAAGNLYVADTLNNRITKGTPVPEVVELRTHSLIQLNNRPYVRLRLSGPAGVRVRLERSSFLQTWSGNQSFTLGESPVEIDEAASGLHGFLRARMVP